MTKLYMSYETESHCVREPDPEDSWDNGDYTGDYHVTGVRLTPGWYDSYETEEEVKAGDTVHVVYVAYDSGSTFGTDGGYGEIIAVTKDSVKAVMVEDWVEQELRLGYDYSFNRDKKNRASKPWPEGVPVKGYLSCHGYFEHNQRVRIETFIVRS